MSNIEALGLNVEEEAKGMTDFAALPPGEYQVVITEAELKENKNGQGQHVGITMQVIDGELEGRVCWANFNVQNANATAEKIGRAELSACCQAMGLISPKDTDEMKDKPFGIKLGLDRKDPTRNQVKAYFALETTSAPAAEKPAAPKAAPKAAPAAPAATAKKPWLKK